MPERDDRCLAGELVHVAAEQYEHVARHARPGAGPAGPGRDAPARGGARHLQRALRDAAGGAAARSRDSQADQAAGRYRDDRGLRRAGPAPLCPRARVFPAPGWKLDESFYSPRSTTRGGCTSARCRSGPTRASSADACSHAARRGHSHAGRPGPRRSRCCTRRGLDPAATGVARGRASATSSRSATSTEARRRRHRQPPDAARSGDAGTSRSRCRCSPPSVATLPRSPTSLDRIDDADATTPIAASVCARSSPRASSRTASTSTALNLMVMNWMTPAVADYIQA